MKQSLTVLFIITFLNISHSLKSEDSQAQELEAVYPVTDLLLKKGLTYKILFSERTDSVINFKGLKSPSKGRHDFLAFIVNDGDTIVYVGHEDRERDNIKGDGGGGTVFNVTYDGNEWYTTSKYNSIDFSSVGGTINNCGGSLTPFNTILTAEEWDKSSNIEVSNNGNWISDTSNYANREKWENFGWMVEVDPISGKALRKLYEMGRYAHEDAELVLEMKTVYLTDDNSPSVWFKFVYNEWNNLSDGKLFAFKGDGEWIELPNDRDSLNKIRDVAIARGAVMFNRFEWIERIGNKLYITETGKDIDKWKKHIKRGGIPAKHLESKLDNKNNIIDPFGRVLEFDLDNESMNVLLEGGTSEAKGFTFSNPDGLASTKFNGKDYLLIHEDIIGTSLGRSGSSVSNEDEVYNEIYLLEIGKDRYIIDDLMRVAVAPRGCETTGGYFSPDGKHLFLNIQEPDPKNPEPFNRSHTVVVSGFELLFD
ncbi:MAG: hypothetical protein Kapaf2KO_07670 [Candidatus Kapaibacteriales bacterium]